MKKEPDNKRVGEADIPRSALRIPHSDHSALRIPHSDHSALSWCGWSLPVPEAWQPLKIEGGWQKGSMMLGTEESPIVLVKWWRPDEKQFNAEQWMTRRFRELGTLADSTPPTPAGFAPARWVVDLQRKDGLGKTVWYGYALDTGLLVECVSTSEVDTTKRDLFFDTLLPRLTAAPATDPVPWSLYSTTFISPPGYTLTAHRIALGDVALELHNSERKKLTLRQVFPAQLALQRRRMEQWLDNPPFMERRRLRPENVDQDDDSLQQRGWKRLPAPMGWLKPRYCSRMARVSHDRLYIAESQARAATDADHAAEAIASMMSHREEAP